MSILIKGMNMPKNCCECLAFKSSMSGYFLCKASGIAFGKWLPLKIPDWCPLVEVKTPHGRLIDADILYEKFAELDAQALEHTCNLGDEGLNEEWRKWSAILAERTAYKHDVYDAPTVIESEE